MQKHEELELGIHGEYLTRLFRQFHLDGSLPLAGEKTLSGNDARGVLFREHARPEEVHGALIYLFLIKEDESLKTLSRILQLGRLDEVKDFLVELLVTRGVAAHVDVIIRLIRRGSLLDRERLLGALLKLAGADDERILHLLRRYLLYGDQHSRFLAIRAVARLRSRDFTPDLLYLLEKEAAEPVRLAVVEALGSLEDPGAIPGLKWASEHDPLITVRLRARGMLERTGEL